MASGSVESAANVAKFGYISTDSQSTFSFPISALQINHDYGSALVSAWRALFLLFYHNNSPSIKLISSSAQTTPTCTVSIQNGIITLAFNDTIWNGITVLPF